VSAASCLMLLYTIKLTPLTRRFAHRRFPLDFKIHRAPPSILTATTFSYHDSMQIHSFHNINWGEEIELTVPLDISLVSTQPLLSVTLSNGQYVIFSQKQILEKPGKAVWVDVLGATGEPSRLLCQFDCFSGNDNLSSLSIVKSNKRIFVIAWSAAIALVSAAVSGFFVKRSKFVYVNPAYGVRAGGAGRRSEATTVHLESRPITNNLLLVAGFGKGRGHVGLLYIQPHGFRGTSSDSLRIRRCLCQREVPLVDDIDPRVVRHRIADEPPGGDGGNILRFREQGLHDGVYRETWRRDWRQKKAPGAVRRGTAGVGKGARKGRGKDSEEEIAGEEQIDDSMLQTTITNKPHTRSSHTLTSTAPLTRQLGSLLCPNVSS